MRVDIASILRTRAPHLFRWIPRWLVRWVERTLHQQQINHILEAYGDLPPQQFIRACMREWGVTYSVEGLKTLDKNGRYLFASNHPFGGMDGMMLAERIGTRFGDVRVIVNDILMYLDPLAPIFVPVNKNGAQRGANVRAFNEAFEGSAPVLTFPAGLCSRCTKGVVEDIEWRPNFIKRAVQTDRLIVPVYVEGHLSKRFYRLARWRKRLGIKVNIEQIYLPDEMFRQRGGNFKLIFGKPISVKELRAQTGETDNFALARAVKKMSYALAGK